MIIYSYIVVDDEKLTRKGTIKKLEPLRDVVICVGEAGDGAEGLKLIEAEDPDIIITDMNMPNMDGVEFLSCIKKDFPDKTIVIISAYKDFDYAKQAIEASVINYLLKPFSGEDIRSTVADIVKGFNQNKQAQDKRKNMEETQEYIKYDYDIKLLQSCILGYSKFEGTLVSDRLLWMQTAQNRILITIYSPENLEKQLIEMVVQKNNIKDFVLYIQHPHALNMGFLLFSFPAKTSLNKSAFLQNFCSELLNEGADLTQTMFVAISREKQSLHLLNEAYNETLEALNLCKSEDFRQCYHYTAVTAQLELLAWNGVEELLFRIEAAEVEKVKTLVLDLFDYCLKQRSDLASLKFFILHILKRIHFMLHNYMELDTPIHSGSIEKNLSAIYSFGELKAYLTTLFSNISRNLSPQSVYSIDDSVEKIKLYVQRKYQNNLDQEFLSSLFYMNRSYLSHLFKVKTGEKLIDYITQIRIDKAKELLITTDKKMYQISKLVGYDNTKYFFRIFKKQVGTSPEQFRINSQSAELSSIN